MVQNPTREHSALAVGEELADWGLPLKIHPDHRGRSGTGMDKVP